jgi:diadenosine tetraphosphate (Ap4A) HIT family hydrolase
VTTGQCPFCSPAPERIFYQDSLVIGLWDIFPVNPGHALLITRRHVRDWFEASHEERMALTRAVEVARFAIAGSFQADGYNIGINVGEAAGQTVFHLHVHVIPRVSGDVADPRGGIRHVIPRTANYLLTGRAPEKTQALVTGGTDPLLPHLIRHLAESVSADLAVAFTLRSGLDLLSPHLQDLLDRQGSLRVLTGALYRDLLKVTAKRLPPLRTQKTLSASA